ncbi:MAG TPA: carbohydrate kinase family protein [Acidobacteriota bacterium]|nr:carbohydrate kinase family protein [Acidobacteriota bacterium]
MDLVFVGSATYDLLGQVEGVLRSEGHHQLSRWGFGFGGKAPNAAAYSAHAGARTAYVGVVGSDFESSGHKAYLQGLGVEVEGVYRSARKTPLFVSLGHSGVLCTLGAGIEVIEEDRQRLRRHFVQQTLGRKPWALYCSMLDSGLIAEVFAAARQTGIRAAWNPLCLDVDDENLARLLDATDYLFMNEEESRLLQTGLGAATCALVKRYGLSCAATTLGEGGALIELPGQAIEISAPAVGEAIDSTGAGDAFAGTFLAVLARKGPQAVEEAADRAVRTASRVVTRLGAEIPAPRPAT